MKIFYEFDTKSPKLHQEVIMIRKKLTIIYVCWKLFQVVQSRMKLWRWSVSISLKVANRDQLRPLSPHPQRSRPFQSSGGFKSPKFGPSLPFITKCHCQWFVELCDGKFEIGWFQGWRWFWWDDCHQEIQHFFLLHHIFQWWTIHSNGTQGKPECRVSYFPCQCKQLVCSKK